MHKKISTYLSMWFSNNNKVILGIYHGLLWKLFYDEIKNNETEF